MLIITRCSSDDKTVDSILESVANGAVLRTLDIENNMEFNDIQKAFTAGSNYTITIEQQDNKQGGLLESISISAGFVDNTRIDTDGDNDVDKDDVDLSIETQVIRTLTPEDFFDGSRGLPETVITFTSEELVSFTGINETLIEGKDAFSLVLVMTLSDGRTFSINDVNGNVSGGSYFSSPFQYRTIISCAITESLAGTYTYQITELKSAPGGRSKCPDAPLTGEVTWNLTDTPGTYTTSDISFGTFGKCYTDDTFSSVKLNNIAIVWDCTNLVADGVINVVENESGKDDNFTFNYVITETNGSDLTMNFSNSKGDRGVLTLTRSDSKVWPTLLTR